MRRLTLGALILGGGTLMALPFRRPSVPDPTPVDSQQNQSRSAHFDDRSLELLVREVTADVKVPVVYDPHTDYTPAAPTQETRRLPLSYQDLAVPVDRDPIYENRFNATAGVASKLPGGTPTQRIAELERKFAKTKFADESIAALPTATSVPKAIPGEGKQWVFQNLGDGSKSPVETPLEMRYPGHQIAGAQIAGAQIAGAQLASSESMSKLSPGDNSILKPLPPPDDAGDAANPNRQRHWIRQPD